MTYTAGPTACERVSHSTRRAIYLAGAPHGYATFAEAWPRGGVVRYQLLYVPPSLLAVVAEEGEAAIALPWVGSQLLRFVITCSVIKRGHYQPVTFGPKTSVSGAYYVRALRSRSSSRPVRAVVPPVTHVL